MIVKVQYRNQKKYIKIPEACFDIFITEGKFSIPVDNILSVEDETGTEVDDYAFPDLLTKYIILYLLGEPSSASGTDTLSVTSKSSSENDFYSGTLKRFRKEEEALQGPQAKNLIKQVLLTKPGGSDVLKEYEEKGTISPATRKVMVNILVADMVQSEGRIPQRLTKEKYALGIVTLFPSLQDPHGKTGYEHFYDGQKGDEQRFQELISVMNHTNDSEVIMKKMRDTLEYRQRLVHDPDRSSTVLSVFPWLLDTKGLILQDFSLLFGSETSSKLLEKWPTSFKAKNQRGDEPSLESPEWDSDMASILLLLHLLSPQPAGRKKTQKISVAQAIDHLVVFHKSCRSLDEHLQSHMDTNQPYLLASGTSKEAIGNFFILIDKKLIPCEATTSLAAIDELFKLHFVLGTSYDPALKSMYIFLQTTVYNIDVDTTSESPKVKELRTKFVSNV
ncbi:Arginine--tRNA ligase [Dissostichus eleginoides]|uniref:Arginine--tRNA ligase n=1 Tax=Dissostichus eleginoides TaxID=100907 RepID=A0AAD9FBE0_DISEL|nr:Arginine--tRNA ligase [Dissostichus eleginoides]